MLAAVRLAVLAIICTTAVAQDRSQEGLGIVAVDHVPAGRHLVIDYDMFNIRADSGSTALTESQRAELAKTHVRVAVTTAADARVTRLEILQTAGGRPAVAEIYRSGWPTMQSLDFATCKQAEKNLPDAPTLENIVSDSVGPMNPLEHGYQSPEPHFYSRRESADLELRILEHPPYGLANRVLEYYNRRRGSTVLRISHVVARYSTDFPALPRCDRPSPGR